MVTTQMFLSLVYDPTLTFGNVLQIISLIGVGIAGYQAIKGQLIKMQETLDHHAERIQYNDRKVERIEEAVKRMGEHVQRLVGRAEADEIYRGIDRRGSPRDS